jgi:phenylacetic acid degradation operon negative regulatory protein
VCLGGGHDRRQTQTDWVSSLATDPLRRRSIGAPAARSVLLTILGEYVQSTGEPVWQETLVAALMIMGYSAQTARQALARSVRERWLTSERHGRRARLTLTDETAALLSSGARRIYGFGAEHGWSGEWMIVVLRVPEAQRDVRHQLRTRLAWAGLGSLGGGVWLTPHVEREQEVIDAVAGAPAVDVLSFRGHLSALGEPAEVAAAAWDLESVRGAYDAFIAEFSGRRASAPQSCFRLQTALVHAWRKFPFLDPDLPQELLPAGWPRRRAQRLFGDRHASWAAPAMSYFDVLEAGVMTSGPHGSA